MYKYDVNGRAPSTLACALVLGACASEPGDQPRFRDCGSWRAGPMLLDYREASPVLLLDDGRVLVVGGHFKGRGVPLDTAEIVDVAASVSTFTGSFATTRTVVGASGTVRLSDGRVLSVSPFFSDTDPEVASEVWDPATGAWSVSGTMTEPGGPAVTLRDGRVLVAGGIDWSVDAPLSRSEIWDPHTGEWSSSGAMTTPRTGHALIELARGEPFAVGGFATYPDAPGVGSSEIFDVDSGSWGRLAPMIERRAGSVAILADGRVLAAGGTNESGGYKEQLVTTELYDPEANTWRAVGSMKQARSRFQLTLLADGRVLASGGGQDAQVTSSAEVFDPVSGQWSDTKPMTTGRGGHSAVRLASGEVLIVGGYPGSRTSEIYTPCVRPES
jgi:hypothetical protein